MVLICATTVMEHLIAMILGVKKHADWMGKRITNCANIVNDLMTHWTQWIGTKKSIAVTSVEMSMNHVSFNLQCYNSLRTNQLLYQGQD